MTHGYENGHGAGIVVRNPRNYVRKKEYHSAQPLPPPGNHYADEQRAQREAAMTEAMKIGFQRRRLPGEGVQW